MIESASVVEHIKMYYSLSYLQDTFMKILKQINILRMETWYDFLKLTFAKWSTEFQMVSRGPTKDHKRNWNREVYYSQVLEEVHSTPQGVTQRGQGREESGQRETGPGAHSFIRFTSEVHWGSWAKAGSVNSNQKECGFGNLVRVLSKWCIRRRPWEVGKAVYYKGYWESHLRSVHFLCLWGLFPRVWACMRGLVSV